jgi:pimeloyl-ACP methyl ester carboxylesterase
VIAPLSPTAWEQDATTFAWQGHRLFARVGGTGPALLLLHGFPTSSWDWARLWPVLEPHHRLLALDHLGFGRSDKPRDFAYSVRASADLWEAFALAQGVASARVLAHDYGDSVAQELLARQRDGTLPFRIEAAVFLNGGLFPEAHRALPMQRALAGPFGPLLARLAGYGGFAANLRRICAQPLDEAELREHWRLLRLANGHRVLPALLGYLRERREQRERWVGALQDGRVPLRFVCGLQDPVSGVARARASRAQAPPADVVELDGVGHYPQVEDAGAVLQAVSDFLDGATQAARRNADALPFFAGIDRRGH